MEDIKIQLLCVYVILIGVMKNYASHGYIARISASTVDVKITFNLI